MPDTEPSGVAGSAGPWPDSRRRWFRWIGFFLGIAMLAAAAIVLATHRDELSRCRDAALAAPIWLVGATLLLPLLNWAITSLIFCLLTRRFASVGYREMCMLIGSAWLLNMLPLKPGLLGRIAYHRAISGIAVADSLMVTATAVLTGAIGIAAVVGGHLALDSSLRAVATTQLLWPLLIGAILALLATAGWLRITRRAVHPVLSGGRAALAAVMLRVIDTYVWSLRYFLAFRLIGLDQPFGVCVIVAGVSQFAGQMPVQFGLREWSVGITTAALRPSLQPGSPATVVPGITADLVCRASEIVCALPIGLLSTWWVYRNIRRKGGG